MELLTEVSGLAGLAACKAVGMLCHGHFGSDFVNIRHIGLCQPHPTM